ncbi:MAG: RNA polymerase factor sigma-54 [Bacteroidota bacterium]
MTKSLSLGIEHRQQQTLSPRLQRAVRLLQLSSLDFAQELHEALDENPFLETDEADGAHPAEHGATLEIGEMPFAATVDQDIGNLAAAGDAGCLAGDLDGERESWQADGLVENGYREEGESGFIDLRAVDVSLSEHLLRQLHVLPLSARDLAVAEIIVGSLDDDGYLRAPLPELIGIADLTPPPEEEELHIGLAHVQSLDPAGVGACGVEECLRLQLATIDCPKKRELAGRIVNEQFAALAARDIAGLGRALGRSPGEIQAALDCIRRLDPHPGWRFGSSHIPYVTPDVIVRKVRGRWQATLNPAIVPRVRLNRVYAEMFQRNRCAQHAELAAHLQEARWTVSNVEQRFATILSVSQAIVSRQHHFLEYGALAMKPLGLREIADDVGLHESTVSRVTNNKFMATPLGVFELKYFFSRVMATAGGVKCSGTAIRSLIKELIGSEQPEHPFSDAEIARQLARQGLVVARRTVTKYRQLMRIEAFERRRRHP